MWLNPPAPPAGLGPVNGFPDTDKKVCLQLLHGPWMPPRLTSTSALWHQGATCLGPA